MLLGVLTHTHTHTHTHTQSDKQTKCLGVSRLLVYTKAELSKYRRLR
jgi:hypothetical protein